MPADSVPQTPPTVPDRGSAPPPVRVAAAILALLALVSAALGVFEAFQVRPDRAVVGIGSAILMVAYAVALVLIARGLWRTRAWSRGPAVATQLIHLPVAYSFLGGATVWIGVTLGVLALIVIGCLVSPAATRALVGPATPEEPTPVR
ncbi:hypothetical protein [Mariniluteicoccus flavus]